MNFTFWMLNAVLPQSEKLREIWVAKQLKKLKKNSKILDAGAGECYYKKYCSHLKYTSQDFNQYDGKGDGLGIQTGSRNSSNIDIVSDIGSIPVPRSSFDTVLCVEVLEHLPRPIDALSEFSRVLKKNGTLLLTAPSASLAHYSPFYFYSGFSINFYKENLPKYGFSVVDTYRYGNYFDFLSLELARTPLIIYRKINLLSLPLILIYLIVVPAYVILRILSFLFPSTSDLMSFGICIRARKL